MQRVEGRGVTIVEGVAADQDDFPVHQRPELRGAAGSRGRHDVGEGNVRERAGRAGVVDVDGAPGDVPARPESARPPDTTSIGSERTSRRRGWPAIWRDRSKILDQLLAADEFVGVTGEVGVSGEAQRGGDHIHGDRIGALIGVGRGNVADHHGNRRGDARPPPSADRNRAHISPPARRKRDRDRSLSRRPRRRRGWPGRNRDARECRSSGND